MNAHLSIKQLKIISKALTTQQCCLCWQVYRSGNENKDLEAELIAVEALIQDISTLLSREETKENF